LRAKKGRAGGYCRRGLKGRNPEARARSAARIREADAMVQALGVVLSPALHL
jgi:hypothetical protein